MNHPEWLRKAPDYFKEFYANDFSHLTQDVKWLKWLIGIVLAAVIAGAIAIICTG